MRTDVMLWIDGVSADVSEYLKGVTYREAMDGEADTVELTLHDVPGLFISSWFPRRGSTLELTIVGEYEAMPLGSFVIDEIENSLPPSECKVKATSIPPGSEAKDVKRWRSWEKVPLSTIARDVATGAGLRLFYDTDEDPMIARAEQAEESDLRFLHKLCVDKGLALKLNDAQLIIFDYERYERQAAVCVLKKGSSGIKRFRARTTLNEVYDRCEVRYKHGRKGEVIEGSYEAGVEGASGRTLRLNEKVETVGEANRLARKRLREKNREEVKVTMSVIGDMRLRAGSTVELEGFSVFDGKYVIESARHEVGNGYETTIELSRCLGY